MAAVAPLQGQSGQGIFRHLSREEGLSQSTVTCIQQDHLGYMWFGTQAGLNRFDNYRFEKEIQVSGKTLKYTLPAQSFNLFVFNL